MCSAPTCACGPIPVRRPSPCRSDAALAYYESQGRTGNAPPGSRRAHAPGDVAAGEAFLAELGPYVWRKHLDFATIADIQAMKRQINISKNVGDARVAGHNVKLGRGGIREIEFFAQTQQLIAGGRDDDTARAADRRGAGGAGARTGWIAADDRGDAHRLLLVSPGRREPAADAAR